MTDEDFKIQMSLGGFKFFIGKTAYESLDKEGNYHFTEFDRIKRNPVMFYNHFDVSLSLRGRAFPSLVGVKPFRELEKDAEKGEPLHLVDYDGNNLGRYLILKIRESKKDLMFNSITASMEFEISLKKYEDENLSN